MEQSSLCAGRRIHATQTAGWRRVRRSKYGKKSVCSVRNDGVAGQARSLRPARSLGKRGNSCAASELWNNLIALRPFAFSGFPHIRRGVWGVVGT